MEGFVGMQIYFAAGVPVALLLATFFYMGHRRSCSLPALILTQLFSFIAILLLVISLWLYQVIPDAFVLIILILIVLLYGVGGATLVGIIMEAKARSEQEPHVRDEGDK
jgi:hypothetical protein